MTLFYVIWSLIVGLLAIDIVLNIKYQVDVKKLREEIENFKNKLNDD